MGDEVYVVAPTGERVGPYKASVQKNKVFINKDNIEIVEGGRIIRPLPNGLTESRLILEVDFHKDPHGLGMSHFEITTRKETSLQPKANADQLRQTKPRIFIGHGGSPDWLLIKDFFVERLGLNYEEFNREPVAGRSTKERLLEILGACGLAFIVMTGEDELGDGKRHARQNVVHEAGLFQGRYGFERAIILLEEGCEEFSNIIGIGQIRFPKGRIMAVSEEVRRVLERERLL